MKIESYTKRLSDYLTSDTLINPLFIQNFKYPYKQKMKLRNITSLLLIPIVISFSACAQDFKEKHDTKNPYYSHTSNTKVTISDAQWKKILAPSVYYIARQEGTERPFAGTYSETFKEGNYYCAACGNFLFSSKTKFDSGTGWPSFYQPASGLSVKETTDADGSRTEIKCARCGSHLGHVFNDGPKPTGLRYCMNSAVLDFQPTK